MDVTSTKNLSTVSKSEPCRHCGKPDWCYRVGDLEVCKRQAEPATGWKATGKADSDGTPYYAPITEQKSIRPRQTRYREYPTRDGAPLVRVVRNDDGSGNKKIWQERWDGYQWVKGTGAIPRAEIPVYRYQEVKEAIAAGREIIIAEGEPCVDALWDLGLPATCNIGGSGKWKDSDTKDLEGAQIVLSPDRDKPGVKHMIQISQYFPSAKWLTCFPDSRAWSNLPDSQGVDVADWISDFKLNAEDIQKNVMDTEAFVAKLERQFTPPDIDSHPRKAKKQPELPPASKTAEALAELYREKLAWESEYQLWRHYGSKHDGVWEIETVESVRGLIHSHLRCLQSSPAFNSGYVSSVLTILQSDLEVKDWNEQPDLIPLKDGVLDSKTLQLLPHSPGYRFTWRLPFNWADSAVGCQPVEDFLGKITGNQDVAEVLLCYLSAIVTRRADLQRYLELIGGGGTGKSTFMALAKALAGKDNTVSSQLKLLESNQFETAKFYRKLLVLFPDSERWQGEVSVLKQLTGQDPIRYERKGVQQCRDFVYEGMVILSANEPPESSDRTSGQERRKLTIGLDNRIPEYEGRNLIKEFEPYLPGLLRRVLEISPERVTQLVKHTERYVPALREKKWAQMLETNPIAAWADEALIVSSEAKAYVGIDDPEKTARWLYANFCKYQKENGHRGVLPLKRFSANLRDLLKNQVKIPISQGRDRNGAYIEGVGLRCFYDPDGHRYPRPITGTQTTNCDGCDGKSDGLVTAETLGSVGCDGCDGFLDIKNAKEEEKKSPPIKIQSETPIDREENPPNPSHPSPPGIPATADASPYPSHADKVTVPSHAEPSLPFEDDSSYSTYPHLVSKDPRTQRNEAEKIRQLLLAVTTKDELSVIHDQWNTRFEWVWHRMSPKERNKVDAVTKVEQLNLLDVKPQPKVEEETQSPVPSQESPVEDEWLDPEELKNMAIALDSCESKEALALLRQCWPPHAMNKACKLLTPEKHEQIKRWVIEQRQSES